MSSGFGRVIAWAIALFVGLVYGTAGSLAHASHLGAVPVGLLLGVVGSVGLVAALRLLTDDRWAALAAGGGIMLATYFFSLPTAGGSALFTEQHEALALIWMAAPSLATAVIVAWPQVRPDGDVSSGAN